MDKNKSELITKRRKLNKVNKYVATSYCKTRNVMKRKLKIGHLPIEILKNIFNKLSGNYLAQNVRLVSKYFSNIVNHCLREKFYDLYNRLQAAKSYVKSKEFIEKFHLSQRRLLRISYIINMLILQFKILEATIWRYIGNSYKQLCCMFGGKLLDVYDDILLKIYSCPQEVKVLNKKFPDLEHVCDLTKLFITYFENNSEIILNQNCYISGAKLCDYLDCLLYAEKSVLQENHDNGTCILKIKYIVNKSWFTVFNYNCYENSSPISWQQEQKYMYLRLRRLAIAHTHFYLEQDLWNKELLLKPPNQNRTISFINKSYAGVGDLQNNLYFYGTLNAGAYALKFSNLKEQQDESQSYLQININLRCPAELSTLYFYKKYCMDFDRKYIKPHTKKHKKIHFKLNIEFLCGLSKFSRLPSRFVFNVFENSVCQ